MMPHDTKPRAAVQIRWFIRRDLPIVLEIEHASFEFGWTEEDFLAALRQRNVIGMVAEHENRIVGLMIYELFRTKLHIMNFAVSPHFRRLSVGTQMIERLINKLSQQRRREITLDVRETNLAAQKFFAACGFKATGVLRGHYADSIEDAYVMRYGLFEDEPVCVGRNRVSAFFREGAD